jgi:hypothetical protein
MGHAHRGEDVVKTIRQRSATRMAAITIAATGLTAASALPAHAALRFNPVTTNQPNPTIVMWTLSSSPVTVHTSSGKTLRMQVALNWGYFSPPNTSPTFWNLTVGLTTGTSSPLISPDVTASSIQFPPVELSAGETHNWVFRHVPRPFPDSPESGNSVSFSSKHALAGFGKMMLAFRPRKGAASVNCDLGSGTAETGRLSGVLNFKTGSKAWGVVSTHGKSLVFPTGNTLTFSDGCEMPERVSACSFGFSWASPMVQVNSNGRVLRRWLQGQSLKSALNPPRLPPVATISAYREVGLSKPVDSTREDLLTATGAQQYDSSARVLTVAAAPQKSPIFTGTATITTAGSGSQGSYNCSANTLAIGSDTYQLSPIWANGGSPLAANFVIGGPLSIGNGDAAEIVAWAWQRN